MKIKLLGAAILLGCAANVFAVEPGYNLVQPVLYAKTPLMDLSNLSGSSVKVRVADASSAVQYPGQTLTYTLENKSYVLTIPPTKLDYYYRNWQSYTNAQLVGGGQSVTVRVDVVLWQDENKLSIYDANPQVTTPDRIDLKVEHLVSLVPNQNLNLSAKGRFISPHGFEAPKGNVDMVMTLTSVGYDGYNGKGVARLTFYRPDTGASFSENFNVESEWDPGLTQNTLKIESQGKKGTLKYALDSQSKIILLTGSLKRKTGNLETVINLDFGSITTK